MSESSADKSVKTVGSLGIATSTSSTERVIKDAQEKSSKPRAWLSKERWLVARFDNMVCDLAQKAQAEGKSANTVDGTSKLLREVEKWEAPDEAHFEVSEGRPDAAHAGQATPAPALLPPVELLDDEKLKKLLSSKAGVSHNLKPKTFQADTLGLPEGAAELGASKMDPADGKRAEACLKLLCHNYTYALMHQFLSTDSTIQAGFVPLSSSHASPAMAPA